MAARLGWFYGGLVAARMIRRQVVHAAEDDRSELADGPMAQFHRAPLLEAVRHLRPSLGGRSVLLDVGCGAGNGGATLASGEVRVAGLDRDRDALVRARLRFDDLALVLGDAHALPLSDCSVDGVLSVSLMQYVDWAGVVGECHRVLKPGAPAVFIENLRGNPLVGLYRIARRLAWAFPALPVLRRIASDGRPVRHLRWRVREDFAARFDSVEFSAHHVLTPVVLSDAFVAGSRWSPSRRNRRVFAALSELDRRLLRRVPGARRLAWIVVVKARKGE